MYDRKRAAGIVLLASVASLALAGCESSGISRFGSVGSAGVGSGSGSSGGTSNATADAGGSASGGTTGTTGTPGGSGGSGSTGGSGSGSGGTSATAQGSGTLIGPDGLAGTGLARNASLPAGGGVLATAGNVVLGVSGRAGAAGQPITNTVPLAGTVTRVLDSTGQALVKAGNGQSYLVDGVSAALGEAVTVKAGQGTLIGPGANPLVGVNVGNGTPTTGQLATVGVGQAGSPLTAAVNAAPVLGTSGAGTVSRVVDTVTGAVGGATSGAGPVNATAGQSTVIGSSSPLVGASALSPAQSTGSLATVGAGSGGTAATAVVNPVTTAVGGTAGAVTGAVPSVGGLLNRR